MRLRASIFAVLIAAAPTGGAHAQMPDPYFPVAERVFMGLDADTRLWFQLFLTSAGHWPAVPNLTFSRRLFQATKEYQLERGEMPTGVLTGVQVRHMLQSASSVLTGWGMRWIPHPTRGRSLWVPMGLGLQAQRTERGADIQEARKRFKLSFNFVPGATVRETYEAIRREMRASRDTIDYEALRPDFFVLSVSQGRYKRYVRYHTDGGGILGFDMSWSSDEAPIFGSRLVTIVSGSFAASMNGTPYPSVPRGNYPWDNEPAVAKLPTPPPAPAPAATPVPAEPTKKSVSSGSGFFVSRDGHLITNAHVVADCGTIAARPDGALLVPAQVVARDTTNDLAVLKIAGPVEKTLAIRPSVRLGEGIAAFGFPHTNLLATTGNFTLGNVTALAGLKDDSRYLQVSAPVQSGNSGGPLLDGAGNVVGVVSAKLDAIKVAAAQGDLPQNVNFAVKSSVAISFLDANQIPYEPGSPADKLDTADLAEKAKKASVFIRCQP